MKRIPMTNGDEYDALTGWRRYLHWHPGERRRIKRAYRRRERRMGRKQVRREMNPYLVWEVAGDVIA